MRARTVTWIVAGIVGVAAFAGGIVTLVFWLTSGVVEAAESFLMLVGQSRYEEAYRSAAPEFRAAQNLDAFRGHMQRAGLDKFNSASWSTRQVRNDRGRVRGTARTLDGKNVPVLVLMVRGDGTWLVTGIATGPPAAAGSDED